MRTRARNLRVIGPRVVGVGQGPCAPENCGLPPGADTEAFANSTTRSFEVFSSGIDEAFQGIGGDPYRGTSNFGLRVPFLPTTSPDNRYLFNLASYTLAEGQRSVIVGFRMFWSLGVKLGPLGGPFTIIEQPVDQPGFYLPDGNVSWHMHRIAPNEVPLGVAFSSTSGIDVGTGPKQRSTAFRMSNNPALLFETIDSVPSFYVDATAYTAPNLGRPWGTMLKNNLGTMLDLRTQWRTHGAWHSMQTPVDGPCTVAFFASVQQTKPSARPNPPFPLPTPFLPFGLSPEWQFVFNFPFNERESTGAVIWRVAGAMIVEEL